MRQVEPTLAVIIISGARQKDVRQKKMIKATAFGRNGKALSKVYPRTSHKIR
jgi:hypothetical protein